MARLAESVERQIPLARRGHVLAIVADALGLLAFPYSVLAVTQGRANLALVASAVATVTIAIRAILTAGALEAATRSIWTATIAAAARYPVVATKSRPESTESVAVLIEATHTTAQHDAVIVPHALASLVALLVVAAGVVHSLGWMALVVGALAAGGVGAFMLLAHRKLGPLREKGWADFGELSLQLRVLLEGATELRAHDRERAHAEAALERARAVARSEREVSVWSGLMGFWPLAVATVMVAGPMKAGVAWARELFAIENAPEVGLLGATGIMLVWNIARAIQRSVMDAPTRRALADFVARAPAAAPDTKRATGAKMAPDLLASDIVLEHVSVVHSGSRAATPLDVTFTWKPNRGLAVTGVNGAGKSTLALVVLGLLDCTEGRITIGEVALADIDPTSLRRKIAYVPQGAFISPGATVGWHLALLLETAPEPARAAEALAKVGLLDVLRVHAGKSGDVLLVPVGKLSGGERQRMLLARALLQDAELMIFDEPEVALDGEGRALLRRLLEELSATRRVLVIAHDAAVVPPAFAHLTLERGDFAARALAAE